MNKLPILAVMLLLASASFAVDIGVCGTLTSNTVYRLNQSIVFNTGNSQCFSAASGSSNITFDMNGYQINLNNSAGQVQRAFIFSGTGTQGMVIKNGTINITNTAGIGVQITGNSAGQTSNVSNITFIMANTSTGLVANFQTILTWNCSFIQQSATNGNAQGTIIGYSVNANSRLTIFDSKINLTSTNYSAAGAPTNSQTYLNTTIGNFWANPAGTGFSQTCVDGNSDGVCDSIYNLTVPGVGGHIAIDYLPRAAPGAGNFTLTLIAPTPINNSNISASSFMVNASATANLSTAQLEINGTTNYTMTIANNNTAFLNQTGMSDGTYTYRVLANSTGNVWNFTTIYTITLDTITPNIVVLIPENSTYNTTTISLNFTVSDLHLSSCWYSLDGGANTTLANCANSTLTSLSQGSHNLIVYANDTAGNKNQSSVNFTVNTVIPFIGINSPASNTILNTSLISINLTILGTGINYTNISIYNASGTLINSTLNSSNGTYVIILGVQSDGIYNITASVFNNAGSENSTTASNITIDTTNPLIAYAANSAPNGGFLATSFLFLNITYTEPNRASTIANINGSLYNMTCTATSCYLNQSLIDGVYFYNITMNDSVGHQNTTTNRNITIDTTNPTITINSPIGQYNYTTSANLNFSVNDLHTDKCWYSLDGGANTSLPGCGNTSLGGLSGGIHNLIVYSNDSANNLGLSSVNFTVNLTIGVSLLYPLNGTVAFGNTIFFTYETINPAPISCQLSIGGDINDLRTIASSSSIVVPISLDLFSSYYWSVNCSDLSSTYSNATQSFNFTTSNQLYSNLINLTNFSLNVQAVPQLLFYDNTKDLNLMFYYLNSSNSPFVDIYKIATNNTVSNVANMDMAIPKSFFVIFREQNGSEILAFNKDNATFHLMDLYGNFTMNNYATAYNVSQNTNYDAYTYANTKQFDFINYKASSYFLFILPTNGSTYLMQKNISVDNLTQDLVSTHARTLQWQTIAAYNNLTKWYYAFPRVNDGTTDFITLYSWNGSASTQIATPDNTAYTKIQLENASVFFEAYQNYTYMMISNITNKSIIYRIEDQKNITLNYNISLPSNFIFVDSNTFLFVSTENGSNFVYSCYFATTPDCQRLSSSNYGAYIIYSRGQTSTSKRDNESDTLVSGVIVNGEVVKLAYTLTDFDSKFRCYDEINDTRLQFIVSVFTNSSSSVLNSYLWGYALPSSLMGVGEKRFVSLCQYGTNRQYFSSLNSSLSMDFYSLNVSLGAYYTFQVSDQFGVKLGGVKITASTFDNLKQAWVVIEQAKTNPDGTAVLFLRQNSLNRMIVETNGYVVQNFDFTPGLITTVQITLQTNGTVPTPMPNYVNMWDDISYRFYPNLSWAANSSNLTFYISSASGSLQFYGVKIIRFINGSSSVVYNANITNQPSGGSLSYLANVPGTYYIYAYFKHQNFSVYQIPAKMVSINGGNGSFQLVSNTLQGGNSPFSGWSIYFAGVIIAMVCGGFASKYIGDGAGVVSVLVLWGFTALIPDAILVCVAGTAGNTCSVPITTLHTTILTTIAVASVLYMRNPYS